MDPERKASRGKLYLVINSHYRRLITFRILVKQSLLNEEIATI